MDYAVIFRIGGEELLSLFFRGLVVIAGVELENAGSGDSFWYNRNVLLRTDLCWASKIGFKVKK